MRTRKNQFPQKRGMRYARKMQALRNCNLDVFMLKEHESSHLHALYGKYVFMIPKIKDVKPMTSFYLSVVFDDGKAVPYNVMDDIK